MATTASQEPRTIVTGAKNRPWELRAWSGITVTAWFRALVKHRFAVSPSRIPMALLLTNFSFFNSAMRLLQLLVYGRRIARTELVEDPIFVLGHWRSGTTLLHELLVCDPRHTYPDTYACFCPNHFLVTRSVMSRLLAPFAPKQRPMDNMVITWQHPQEEEWALCNMGLGSPYYTMLFPNHLPVDEEYLDLRELSPKARERWKRKFRWFLQCLTVQTPKRIVLKSPPHTARVKTLLEMFPRARFVHIVRSPYVIFPSTIHTWKRLFKYQGIQVPRFEGIEEQVFHAFNRMYDAFEEDRSQIDPSRFCEVRYEDLVEDPVKCMRGVYEGLGLDGFEQIEPAIQRYAAEKSDYKTNRYALAPRLRDEIREHWGHYAEKYGYEAPEADG